MALKINTNIENDIAGGYLVDGKAVKMENGRTLEETLSQTVTLEAQMEDGSRQTIELIARGMMIIG